MRRTGILAMLIAAALVGNGVLAADNRPRDEVDAELIARIGNQPLEAFLAAVVSPIRRSADGIQLTRDEVEAARRAREASRRATEVGQWLRYDLDGDGAITMDEITAGQRAQAGGPARAVDAAAMKLQIRQKADRLMQADADGDGQVDLSEMLASARTTAPARPAGQRDLSELLLELDADGDGATTVKEVEDRARALFALYDRDGDGIIDPGAREEIARTVREVREKAKLDDMARRCTMPRAGKDDSVVFFKSGTGQAISTVAVGGVDRATLTIPVTIEQGTGHIYLVLSSDRDMVWRLEGAVDRLSHVVLIEGNQFGAEAFAGVTGLEQSRVSFAIGRDCILSASSANNRDGQRSMSLLRRVVGQDIDGFASVPTAASVSIPSLPREGTGRGISALSDRDCLQAQASRNVMGERSTITVPKDCDWLNAEARLFYPGGLVTIDPAAVVAHHVETYKVLPSPYGIIDALADGTLVDLSDGHRTHFRVVKPLAHLPPVSMFQSVLSLELARGIQPPIGDVRGYCVRDSQGELVIGTAGRCLVRR